MKWALNLDFRGFEKYIPDPLDCMPSKAMNAMTAASEIVNTNSSSYSIHYSVLISFIRA